MAIKVLTLDGVKTLVKGIKDWAVGKFVAKEEGKGLSANDYTTEEKNKLAGIAEQAQVNVIEAVKVNGAAVAVADKAVDIDLSAYAIKSEMETALGGKVDKADGMSLMSDAEKAKIANLAADANATYATKDELSAIPKFEVVPVDELPATGEVDKIYLVPNEGSGTNARDEFIYVNGAWEMLGTTEVDLSGYYTSAQIDEKIAAIEGDVGAVYTKTEIDGMVSTINGDIDAVETEVAKKANAADVYTKTEVDSAVGAVDAKFANYSTTEQMNSAIGVVDAKFANYVLSADLVAMTDDEINAAVAEGLA